MIFSTNLQEATRSLVTSKQRTLLALLGIVIGIGSVIGMVSIGAIVQKQALKQFTEMGIDIISATRQGTLGTSGGLALEDIMNLKSAVPAIREVAPYVTSSTTYQRGGTEEIIMLLGVTGSFFNINKLHLKEGRTITDLDENRYFCVIGADLAHIIGNSGVNHIIGSNFTLGKRIFTIVGVLERITEGGGMRPYGINRAALVPITSARRSFDRPDIDMFMARVDKDQSTATIKQSVQNYFMSRGNNLNIQSAEELIAAMQSQMRLFTLLLGAIGSISLIVGGIGVMNVMLISVAERRKEIGIRRALGALQSDIQSQFIIESVTLCSIGGIIGILLGVLVSYFYSRFNHWDFSISYASIILGLGVASAVGVFFGFYPARSAARLDPITALRY